MADEAPPPRAPSRATPTPADAARAEGRLVLMDPRHNWRPRETRPRPAEERCQLCSRVEGHWFHQGDDPLGVEPVKQAGLAALIPPRVDP